MCVATTLNLDHAPSDEMITATIQAPGMKLSIDDKSSLSLIYVPLYRTNLFTSGFHKLLLHTFKLQCQDHVWTQLILPRNGIYVSHPIKLGLITEEHDYMGNTNIYFEILFKAT